MDGKADMSIMKFPLFAKPGFISKHNSSYWRGKKYLGIGPSAHSFDGASRQWNISNNNIYIDSIEQGIIPYEKEILTPTQQLNEYIMTSLRTMEGSDLDQVEDTIGHPAADWKQKIY
jgi:oxygen-independent coproporphyrinogen-3 oxidase